jgi:hypothetical protein
MAAGGAELGREIRFCLKTTVLLLDDVRRTTGVEDFFSGETRTTGTRALLSTSNGKRSTQCWLTSMTLSIM